MLSCSGVQEKIAAIAKDIYGAKDVSYDELAERQLKACEDMGGAKLPICMAKTQYSFSADAAAKGAPSGFTLPIRDVRVGPGRLLDCWSGIGSMCVPLCVMHACVTVRRWPAGCTPGIQVLPTSQDARDSGRIMLVSLCSVSAPPAKLPGICVPALSCCRGIRSPELAACADECGGWLCHSLGGRHDDHARPANKVWGLRAHPAACLPWLTVLSYRLAELSPLAQLHPLCSICGRAGAGDCWRPLVKLWSGHECSSLLHCGAG